MRLILLGKLTCISQASGLKCAEKKGEQCTISKSYHACKSVQIKISLCKRFQLKIAGGSVFLQTHWKK